MIGMVPIFLGLGIASLMVTFQLCWRKSGTLRNVLIPVVISAICAGALYWLYNQLANGAEPQVREQWQLWLGFGVLASVGGPLIGAIFALIARKRVSNGKITYGSGKPGQFNH
jgi:uncharacterized protein involved in cysteine biosynthesis